MDLAQKYPEVAEPIAVWLGRELQNGLRNDIPRPIYLPALNLDDGVDIEPGSDARITVPSGENAIELFIAADTVTDSEGNPFTGRLSVTELAPGRTPAPLPLDTRPDHVITVQPSGIQLTTAAPLTMPNTAGYPRNSYLELFGVNESTGAFVKAGEGKVNDDGTAIETTSGGVTHSSWYFFSPTRDDSICVRPPPGQELPICFHVSPPTTDPPEDKCPNCKEQRPLNSTVELQTGAVIEQHSLPTYYSLGATRGVTLVYDSLRADPRPIVSVDSRVYVPNEGRGQESGDLRLATSLSLQNGEFSVPAANSEHYWRIPQLPWEPSIGIWTGRVQGQVQLDLSDLPTGIHPYKANIGVLHQGDGQAYGRTDSASSEVVTVNTIASDFGSGWGVAGWQQIIELDDGRVMLVDGDGTERVFNISDDEYQSPAGDFSELTRLTDGRFVRTLPDQMVYEFNSADKLSLIRDRNGNETQFNYDDMGKLISIVDPVGLATTLSYTNDRVTLITDPADRETALAYDNAGNLQRVTNPDGSTRTWSYDNQHHMVSETDERGNVERTTYDETGRARSALLKDGSRILVQPAQTRGLADTSDAANVMSDNVGVLTIGEAIYVDGTGSVEKVELDAGGQYVSSTNAVGEGIRITRNSSTNLVTRITDSRGNDQTFTHDTNGNQTTAVDSVSLLSASSIAVASHPAVLLGGYGGQQVVSDVNKDGYSDLVVAQSRSGAVDIILGKSTGSLSSNISQEARFGFHIPYRLLVTDLNGDGFDDIVTANSPYRVIDYSVTTLLGNGDGTFGNQWDYYLGDSQVRTMAAGDINEDGHQDLIMAAGETLLVFSGNGDGSFEFAVTSIESTPAYAVELADLSGDGHLDLVLSGGFSDKFYKGLTVQPGRGDGTFGEPILNLAGEFAEQFRITDLDSDGLQDIVYAGGDLQSTRTARAIVIYGEMTVTGASFSPPVSLLNGEGFFDFTSNLDIADVNGDRRLDVVVAGPTGPILLLNDGERHFQGGAVIGVKNVPHARPTFGDFDGDGNVDLAVQDLDDVIVHYGDGSGSFAPPGFEEPTASFGDKDNLIVDFDGDTQLDVISVDLAFGTVDDNQYRVSVQLGNGDGIFTETASGTITIPRYHNVDVIGAKDVTGDGLLDVVMQSGDTVYVLAQNENSGLTSASTIPLGVIANRIRLADVNEDGLEDMVVQEAESGVLDVRLRTEVGFTSMFTVEVGELSSYSFELVDVTNDGRPDIVINSSGSDDVLFPGNSGGMFSAPEPWNLPSGMFADIDKNGSIDLIAQTSRGLSISVDLASARTLRHFPRQAYLSSPQIADANNDGNLDLIGRATNDVTWTILGDGHGSFPSQGGFYMPGDQLLTGDFNEDGLTDFITGYNYRSDELGNLVLGNAAAAAINIVPDRRYTFYDATFSQPTEITDERGNQTLFNIDPTNGNILSVREVVGSEDSDEGPETADDVVTGYTYTPEGLVNTVTDTLGRVTDYDYDAFGRVERITFAKGTSDEAAQQFEYDDAGNQRAFINENGARTTYRYDEMNRLREVVEPDPDGLERPLPAPRTTFDYDLAGNLKSTTDARDNTTTYTYDSRDRMIAMTDADQNTTTYRYDSKGNLIVVRDPLGHATKNSYDARDRLVATVDAEGGVTRFAYDLDDNLTSLTDPVGNTTRFVYDSRSRLTREVDPLGNPTSYSYDGARAIAR